jgi:hypothetical protein
MQNMPGMQMPQVPMTPEQMQMQMQMMMLQNPAMLGMGNMMPMMPGMNPLMGVPGMLPNFMSA